MFYWALIFFFIALITGLIGYGDVTTAVSLAVIGVSQVLFWVFLIVFFLALVAALLEKRGTPML